MTEDTANSNNKIGVDSMFTDYGYVGKIDGILYATEQEAERKSLNNIRVIHNAVAKSAKCSIAKKCII